MQIHEMVCDQCGKRVKFKITENKYCLSPTKWSEEKGRDLCPKCCEKYEKHQNDWFEPTS